MIKVLLCFISRRRSKRLSSQFLCAKKSLGRSEEHTSELQSQSNLVCRLLLEKKKVFNAEAGAAGLDEETADLVVLLLIPGPNDSHVGDPAGGDPHLLAVKDIFLSGSAGSSSHAAGIGAEIGLGESEATELFTFLHCRQPLLLLLFAAESVDRVHH